MGFQEPSNRDISIAGKIGTQNQSDTHSKRYIVFKLIHSKRICAPEC